MKKSIPVLFLMTILTINASARSNSPENNADEAFRREIEETLKHYYAAGDAASPVELGKAFDPGAMMFWADAGGQVNHFTQRQWKNVLRETKKPVRASKRDLRLVDCTKDVCVAKIVSTFPDRIYYDYMAMVKIAGKWKIVCKVYFRSEPASPPVAARAEDKKLIEALLETKFKSMDANDPDLLASVYYPRAMSYYADEDQLTAVSIGEWIARFAFDKKKNAPVARAVRKILQIDTAESVGYARFTHDFPGVTVTDYTLLLKSENSWRVINLLITTEEKKRAD